MRPDKLSFSMYPVWPVLALLLFVVLVGCLPPERNPSRALNTAQGQSLQHNGRINFFLTLEDKQGPAIELEIASLEVLSQDVWLPLTNEPVAIDSAAIGSTQLFLAGMMVPPGNYSRLRLTVTKGRVQKAGGEQLVSLEEPQQIQLVLDRSLSLEAGESKTLLCTWDVENSLQPDDRLTPDFFVTPALRQLPVNMVFVACPDIDTIFIVRTDKNWVVDSFGVRGRPTFLAIEPSSARQLLYVLTPAEKNLKVVDLSSQRVIDAYPTLNDTVTYFTISPDGQWAYLLHKRSGFLSRMNLQSGQIESRTNLGSRPNYAVYLKQQKLLAVSLSLSQRVLLLDPESLKIVRTISTGSNPEGMLILDNRLYIAESGDASVSTTDLGNSSDNNRRMVGFGPRRLLDTGDQIIVSNYNDGSLSILLPGQLSVVQEIYGLGQPLEMVFDQFYRHLYVADERQAGLAVVDVNTNKLLGYISLGAKPGGLAKIQ